MFVNSARSDDFAQQNDDDLWKAFLDGRQKALGVLFLKYYTRLFQYGVKLVGSEDLVKDGIQELFLKLWNNRENIEPARSIEFYLLFSLRRILLEHKKRSNALQLRNQSFMQMVSLSQRSAEDKIVRKETEAERYEKFQKAVTTLTARQKEVLYLRLHHGMTNKEISKILSLSVQRVKNYISETTQILKEHVYTQESAVDH